MDLLVCLVERAGETIPRAELLDAVWGDRHVVEAVLTQAVSQLRRAFDDDQKTPRYVQTVHGRGYRLIAPVEKATEAVDAAVSADERSPARWSSRRWRRLVLLTTAAFTLIAVIAGVGARRRNANKPAPTFSSIAVLPFENLSGESDEYLASGLTEMLITDLAKIPDLKVIAYPSVKRYREGGAVPEFATQVGVEAVLKGSVSRSGSDLRMIAHLLSGATGELLWARSYDRTLADLLGLQSELSFAVTREIQGQISLEQVAALADRELVDAEAYSEYLKGRLFWNRRTNEDLRASREHFEKAIELAPDFALAHAGLADALIVQTNYMHLSPSEALPRAEELVTRALELEPDLAEAHASLGLLRVARDWDWAAAERSYIRAIELQPGYATAHQWYAECLSFMGRHQEALVEVRKAAELDPLSPLMLAVWGQRLVAAGAYDEATARLGEAVAKDPGLYWSYRELAYAYRGLGDLETAREHLLNWRGFSPEIRSEYERAFADGGEEGFWRLRLERAFAMPAAWISAPDVAEAYAALGETELAMEWLGRSVEQRTEHFPHIIKSPYFDVLEGDPRFIALLQDSGAARPPA